MSSRRYDYITMLTQRPLFDLQKGRKHLKSLFEAFNFTFLEIRVHSWIQRVKFHISNYFYVKIPTSLLVFQVLSCVVTY